MAEPLAGTSITTITLPLGLGMGSVNCFLLAAGAGWLLVDTGGANGRRRLLRALEAAGIGPGGLRLIALTHGDFDHSGNAQYLRRTFGCPVAMHAGDAPMGESGDMFAGRRSPNALVRALVPVVSGFGRHERFTPDWALADGDSLAAYGVEARVVATPGHSAGSIALLTADGDLVCGDLFGNTAGPARGALVDDAGAFEASLCKVSGLGVHMVFPGHGEPFAFERLRQTLQGAGQ